MNGKEKCRLLKEIRQQYADRHQISYTSRECDFEGPCKGTCPLCEMEKRYLNEQTRRQDMLQGRNQQSKQENLSDPRFPLLGIFPLRVNSDGPGVRSLVVCAECPINCVYCINRIAIQKGKTVDIGVQELMQRLAEDSIYYTESGGGITFGGGEPMLYAKFIDAFRKAAPPEWGITIETSLAVETLTIFPDADYIVDCKSMDPDIYHKYTGGDQRIMQQNLTRLLELMGPERIMVRVPEIPGYNTKEDQQRSVEELIRMGFRKIDTFRYTDKRD